MLHKRAESEFIQEKIAEKLVCVVFLSHLNTFKARLMNVYLSFSQFLSIAKLLFELHDSNCGFNSCFVHRFRFDELNLWLIYKKISRTGIQDTLRVFPIIITLFDLSDNNKLENNAILDVLAPTLPKWMLFERLTSSM